MLFLVEYFKTLAALLFCHRLSSTHFQRISTLWSRTAIFLLLAILSKLQFVGDISFWRAYANYGYATSIGCSTCFLNKMSWCSSEVKLLHSAAIWYPFLYTALKVNKVINKNKIINHYLFVRFFLGKDGIIFFCDTIFLITPVAKM